MLIGNDPNFNLVIIRYELRLESNNDLITLTIQVKVIRNDDSSERAKAIIVLEE